MRLRSFLLVLSVAANAALVAVLLLRPAPPAASGGRTPISRSIRVNSATGVPRDAATIQAALASGDRAALLAAGVSEEVARNLSIGRAYEILQTRTRALQAAYQDDGRYWRPKPPFNFDGLSRKRFTEIEKADREFSQAVHRAEGGDLDTLFDGGETPYAYLPRDKREQLRRIERDYSEMESQVGAGQNGILLPADREKIRWLGLERERDIAAALTPEERQQYDLHDSRTAVAVRLHYGDAIQTEEQYLKIYALQKAFDDHFSKQNLANNTPPSPESQRVRTAAEQQLQSDILAAIPADQLAAFRRASDSEVKTLNVLVQRFNLPATINDAVLAARDAYAAQSIAINANIALSADTRRAQLRELANKAQAELQSTLGADGAQIYAERAPWLNLLKNGTAFSTNPADAANEMRHFNASVYSIQPPQPPRKE